MGVLRPRSSFGQCKTAPFAWHDRERKRERENWKRGSGARQKWKSLRLEAFTNKFIHIITIIIKYLQIKTVHFRFLDKYIFYRHIHSRKYFKSVVREIRRSKEWLHDFEMMIYGSDFPISGPAWQFLSLFLVNNLKLWMLGSCRMQNLIGIHRQRIAVLPFLYSTYSSRNSSQMLCKSLFFRPNGPIPPKLLYIFICKLQR